MPLAALPLRLGLSFYPKKSSCFLLKWKLVAAQYPRPRLRSFKIKSLSKVTFVCLGIRHVSSMALCEKLAHKVTPGDLAMGLPQIDTRPPSDSILNKIHFIIHLGIRACILFLKFGPLLLAYPFTLISATLSSLWLRLLLKATETSGPACIKLGQWASTRRDLFSEKFCVLFSKLHVKVPPHPWDYTERCLKKAFGDDWRHLLRFQSTEPVGSGCVAQVYKAYLNLGSIRDMDPQIVIESPEQDSAFEAWEVQGLAGIFQRFGKWNKRPQVTGKEKDDREGNAAIHLGPSEIQSPTEDPEAHHLMPVAIKVLHPGLRQQVRRDLCLMKIWSRLLGLIPGFRWLSLTEIVEEFEKLMTQQIDLRFEARNLEIFQQKFEKVDNIKFPSPVRPFVTRNILVETYEEGESLSVFLQDEVTSQIKQRIAAMGVDMLLKMVFVDNFVHADLHPGNILVQGVQQFKASHVDQTTIVDLCDTLVVGVRPSRSPLRLVLLDVGIVAELQERDLQNFRSVFTAVLLGKGDRVAELILRHARANECTDVQTFKSQMAELVNKARGNAVALGKFQVAVLLSQVFRLLMIHKVKLESNFASILFAILVLEGLGRSLDPEINILEAAAPLLVKNAASVK
ncbi:putative aarF domain-containing protein kinase 2 [Pelodytes ibericus]